VAYNIYCIAMVTETSCRNKKTLKVLDPKGFGNP